MNANNETEVLLTMPLVETVPLAEQRQALRQKIRSQRQLIARQLGPDREVNTAYPRSNIMRFFVQRPGLGGKLVAELATVLIGARFIKSMGAAIGFAKRVSSR